MKILALIAVSMLSSATYALEIPVAPHNAFDMDRLSSVKRMGVVNTNFDFEGIIKLSNCSGSLIIFNGMPDTARAIVMTNGHCIEKPGYIKPGEVVVNMKKSRDLKLFKTLTDLKPVKTSKILYATMTDTDIAFYELTQTYEEIKKAYDVDPLLLDNGRPSVGAPIQIISGYWDRGWNCKIDGFVYKMKEKDWTWTDSIRYTATCDTMGGTSGSPIVAKGSRTVVGINNTSNESGETCTINNPCEIDENGKIEARKGVRYGQQSYNIYTCLTPDFSIDLSMNGCELPR